eukprot:scaffold245152_cov27-Prasinocladus_malaysianus.AAC.2
MEAVDRDVVAPLDGKHQRKIAAGRKRRDVGVDVVGEVRVKTRQVGPARNGRRLSGWTISSRNNAKLMFRCIGCVF